MSGPITVGYVLLPGLCALLLVRSAGRGRQPRQVLLGLGVLSLAGFAWQTIAAKFSELAAVHLGVRKDVVAGLTAEGRPAVVVPLLLSAGFAPAYPESPLGDEALRPVRQALDSTGYPRDRIHLVRGMVERTIPDGIRLGAVANARNDRACLPCQPRKRRDDQGSRDGGCPLTACKSSHGTGMVLQIRSIFPTTSAGDRLDG